MFKKITIAALLAAVALTEGVLISVTVAYGWRLQEERTGRSRQFLNQHSVGQCN